MKYLVAAALVMIAMLGVTAAQSNAPTDPTAQPPAPQTTPQSSQAPTAAPTQAPQTSQPATTPAPGGASRQPANSESGNPKRIAPGSVIPVQLTKTIDAKKAKTGDEVIAKVTQDLKSNAGVVVVAKDTKVIGHVTEAQPRSKEQKESQLGVAFDRAVTKDGQEVQMPMSIQAVIGQQNNNPNAGGGNDQAPAGNAGPNTMSSPMAGRSPQGPPPSSPTPSADNGGGGQTANAPRPPINAQTQGVIGISNLSLHPASGTQGSVMTSEKNNVKLESGTMLLLKVNQ